MNTAEAAISSNRLRVVKNKRPILFDLNVTVQNAQITGLVGPSGSGKTTLIRSIVGVQKITSGELMVLGIEAGSRQLHSKIGYMSQSPSVYGDLTVEQNLRYFATITRTTSEDIERVLKLVHLEAQRKQMVETLSGGERARVSLAVALLGDPELLILDEPTVGLDPVLREDLWTLFAELAAGGKTLLISTHVMDEAERCENLVLLRDGAVLWSDSKAALLEHTHTKDVGAAFINKIKEAK